MRTLKNKKTSWVNHLPLRNQPSLVCMGSSCTQKPNYGSVLNGIEIGNTSIYD